MISKNSSVYLDIFFKWNKRWEFKSFYSKTWVLFRGLSIQNRTCFLSLIHLYYTYHYSTIRRNICDVQYLIFFVEAYVQWSNYTVVRSVKKIIGNSSWLAGCPWNYWYFSSSTSVFHEDMCFHFFMLLKFDHCDFCNFNFLWFFFSHI